MDSELQDILCEIARIRANILSMDLNPVSRRYMLDHLDESVQPLLKHVDFGFQRTPRDC